MNENVCGTLQLLEVPPGCEERVIGFLGKFYRGKSKDQLAQLIASPPVVLSRKVPQAVAQKVLAELSALGATGQFEMPREAAATSQPARSAAVAKPEPAPLGQTLARAFCQERLRFPVPLLYRLGLGVVVGTMVLLPLVYVALVAGVGYLVAWHATVNLQLFHTVRSAKGALFAYAGPLIIGALLFFFMIKPLFARRQETWQEIEVSPKTEPLLWNFIQDICASVGAPPPTRLRFDNQVNAAASFRRGLFSFFGNDLVLTIGLPLAGGLNLTEFAGVLAHEFGHFAQSSGMRLTYLIRSVNAWFARVVYEEDAWDLRLRSWSQEIDLRIGIILYLARFFIWMTRRLLWLLMHLGHFISCFMLRQMEFDADRYEAGLVGAETFATTCTKLPLLALAHSQAFDDINQAWKEGKLPDDLTAMVALKLEQLDEETRKTILARQAATRTRFLDTHPADGARIASAQKVDTEPLLSWPDGKIPPAAALFKDFDTLSRRATIEHYRLCLGRKPDSQSLIDVAALARTQSEEKRYAAILSGYFLDLFSPRRSLRLEVTAPPPVQDPKGALERLQAVRQEILRGSQEQGSALEKHFILQQRLSQAGQAQSLLEADFRINAEDFSLPQATQEGVVKAENRYLQQLADSEQKLQAFEALQRERLQLGLGLWQVPAVQKRLGQQKPHFEDLATYWQALATLQNCLPDLEKIDLNLDQLDVLARNLADHREKEALINTLREKLSDLRKNLERLGQRLATTAYPFEHSRHGLTLGSYLFKGGLQEDDLAGCFEAGGEALQNAGELNKRLAGRLAEAAEQVERALGLPGLGGAVEADTPS